MGVAAVDGTWQDARPACGPGEAKIDIYQDLPLSGVAAVVGGALLLVHALAVAQPVAACRAVAAFPRHRGAGWALTAISVVWVALLLYRSHLGPVEPWKPALLVLGPLAIYLIGTHMDELLAARALGGLLLLAPAPLLYAAQWHPSPWRFAVTLLAYVWVVEGTLLVLSPYRLRRQMAWVIASPARCRGAALAGCVFGVLLLGLAATAYRMPG